MYVLYLLISNSFTISSYFIMKCISSFGVKQHISNNHVFTFAFNGFLSSFINFSNPNFSTAPRTLYSLFLDKFQSPMNYVFFLQSSIEFVHWCRLPYFVFYKTSIVRFPMSPDKWFSNHRFSHFRTDFIFYHSLIK